MDDQSIRGYAVAAKVLDEALQGHVDGEKLATMFDRVCENPVSGFAEYHRLARANHVITESVQAEIAEALDDVDLTPGESNDLSTEQQGTFIIAWFKADRQNQPEGMTVPEAAKYLGVSETAIRKAVYDGGIKGSKPKGRWVLDTASVKAYKPRAYSAKPE